MDIISPNPVGMESSASTLSNIVENDAITSNQKNNEEKISPSEKKTSSTYDTLELSQEYRIYEKQIENSSVNEEIHQLKVFPTPPKFSEISVQNEESDCDETQAVANSSIQNSETSSADTANNNDNDEDAINKHELCLYTAPSLKNLFLQGEITEAEYLTEMERRQAISGEE